MKKMEDINISNNKVILRLDLNVTIKDNQILDDTKIKKSIPTIKYLLSTNSNILIMSHLGKVKSEEDKKNNSLKLVSIRLEELLGEKICFVSSTRGSELEESFSSNRITLMENTRFEDYPNKLESNCDMELAKYWASLGEVFINDAFGTTHRAHASNYGLSKFLTTGYGYLIEEEIKGLSPIIKDIRKPFVVIMGGAKVDDKIQLIKSLLKECDYLLVGGGIANTFLKALGYSIGTSLYSSDYIEDIRILMESNKEKILVPLDVVIKEADSNRIVLVDSVPSSSCIYDIGPKTVEKYKEILQEANTIFINGTMGLYEQEEFSKGTTKLYDALTLIQAAKIAGGGDAVASVKKLGYERTFDFLSTGGGATLEYISLKSLKCFEE